MSQDRRYRTKGPVGFVGLFLSAGGFAPVGLACLALVLNGYLAWDAHQVARFNAQADQTTATVMRIAEDKALVRYETPQGSFAQRIRAGRLQAGETMQVYYTPDSPAEIRRSLRRNLPLTAWFQAVATGIGLVALWLGWRSGLRAVRAIQTRRYGAVERVEVTRVEEGRPGKHGGTPPARLHWKQRDGNFGRSGWHVLSHLDQWQPGDETDVYVWKGRVIWRDDVGPRPVAPSIVPQVRRNRTP